MKRFLSVCMLVLCLSQSAKAELEPFWGGCKTQSIDVEVAIPQYDIPKDSLYLVIDLSGGVNATSYPVSYLPGIFEGRFGWPPNYKTDKLVLRRVEAGTFMMGSPDDEPMRYPSEEYHQVTLTKPYYIGAFEVTQKQWSLVMGTDPSHYKGDDHPVESVSYNKIRGTNLGTQWPASAEVDATSFMGKLRAKTSLDFDLPTEAQWEYACRAGMDKEEERLEIAKLMRYTFRSGPHSNHTTVGSSLSNNWGLYDMHSNVLEWSLDWCGSPTSSMRGLGTEAVIDPVGASSGSFRLLRSNWWDRSKYSKPTRSSFRMRIGPSRGNTATGFRVVVRPELQ